MVKTSDILKEYGEAVRGNWGSIDGRTVRRDLKELANIIEKSGDKQFSKMQAIDLRAGLGICMSGNGHWQEYCDENCLTHEDVYNLRQD